MVWWRQPLVHFLLAGAVIFMLDAARGPDTAEVGQRIVVTQAHTQRLADQWLLTWGRPPDEQELQGLVKNYIKEEIYYREALKLGLDVNDPVIRQRLGRKMEFLTTTELTPDDVYESALQSYFERKSDRYTLSATFDFEQRYFKGESDQEAAVTARGILEQLNEGRELPDAGDAIGLPQSLTDADQATITRSFGSAFYRALDELTQTAPSAWENRWAGPVQSGFGAHLVYVSRKREAREPELAEVRALVINDWLAEQNRILRERAFDDLRRDYDIDIELDEQ